MLNRAPSANTCKVRLRHIDSLYGFCDDRFGCDSLDAALSAKDAAKVQQYVEAFFFDLTAQPGYTTTAVQRWDAVRGFVLHFAERLSVSEPSWRTLASLLKGMGKLRRPSQGKTRFVRALPNGTLSDLLTIVQPGSPRNPFKSTTVQWRNWLIVNLLLLCGLRRSEAMLLTVDSLKRDVDIDTGEVVTWLDVTSTGEADERSTLPGIKTAESHRQVPVSADLADLYEHYVGHHRYADAHHSFLLTSVAGEPLSAESFAKMFDAMSASLSPGALTRLRERTGKERVSPHDLRHTCATARFPMFLAPEGNRELAMQRMRAFFGWTPESEMPEHYARAAIQEDLMRTWNELFDGRIAALRGLSV